MKCFVTVSNQNLMLLDCRGPLVVLERAHVKQSGYGCILSVPVADDALGGGTLWRCWATSGSSSYVTPWANSTLVGPGAYSEQYCGRVM